MMMIRLPSLRERRDWMKALGLCEAEGTAPQTESRPAAGRLLVVAGDGLDLVAPKSEHDVQRCQ